MPLTQKDWYKPWLYGNRKYQIPQIFMGFLYRLFVTGDFYNTILYIQLQTGLTGLYLGNEAFYEVLGRM